ncbi:hypothetical protein BDZ45DRAFT_747410 [Acephala macrosclerotiorum]|nr:hypothetical protein BDZ45DRAFT_747410 [Acephala macrosclerotiorum]
MSLPLVPFPGTAASPIATEEEDELGITFNKRFKATNVSKPDSHHVGVIVEFNRTMVRAPWLANAGSTFEYQEGPWCFRPCAAPMGQNPPAIYNIDPVLQLQATIFRMKLGEDSKEPNLIAKMAPGATDEWACSIDNLFGRIFGVESGWKNRGSAKSAVCLIALAFIEQQAIMKENEKRDSQDLNFIAHAFSHVDQAAELSVRHGKRVIRKCDIYVGINPKLPVQDMDSYVGQDPRNDPAPTTSLRKRKAGGQGTIEWNLPTREVFDREIRDSARLLRMARNLKAGVDSIIQNNLGQDGESTKLRMVRQFQAMLDLGTTPEKWASFLEGLFNTGVIEGTFSTPAVTTPEPISAAPPHNTPLPSHSAILPGVDCNASLKDSTTADPGQILPNTSSFAPNQPGFYFNGQFIPSRGDDNDYRVVGTLFQGLFAAKSNAEFQSALKTFFSEFLKPVANQADLSINTANNFALNCMQTFLEAYNSIVPGGEEGVWLEVWQRMRYQLNLAAAAMGLPAEGDSAVQQNAYISSQENQRAMRTHGFTGEGQDGSFRTASEEVIDHYNSNFF